MFGRVSKEIEVKVPASEAWKQVYGTLQLDKIIVQALPTLISKIDIQGDGSQGTIIHIFYVPGNKLGFTSYKEKFMVVDNDRRVKETEAVEGGYLDLGFTLYRVRFEVIEKEGEKNECITRTTIEYELKEEAKANAAFVSIEPFVVVMQYAANYLQKKYNNDNNNNN